MAQQAAAALQIEPQIRRIGESLAKAFPSPGRHPIRSLDSRAMELAASDQQLRTALFQLVDVTPACRSLDELAGHLRAYLREVDDRSPSVEMAMRMAGSRAGRQALGVAAAAGVRHMAHRFIVGESPGAALDEIRAQWRQG